jgi:hypothetical protein
MAVIVHVPPSRPDIAERRQTALATGATADSHTLNVGSGRAYWLRGTPSAARIGKTPLHDPRVRAGDPPHNTDRSSSNAIEHHRSLASIQALYQHCGRGGHAGKLRQPCRADRSRRSAPRPASVGCKPRSWGMYPSAAAHLLTGRPHHRTAPESGTTRPNRITRIYLASHSPCDSCASSGDDPQPRLRRGCTAGPPRWCSRNLRIAGRPRIRPVSPGMPQTGVIRECGTRC